MFFRNILLCAMVVSNVLILLKAERNAVLTASISQLFWGQYYRWPLFNELHEGPCSSRIRIHGECKQVSIQVCAIICSHATDTEQEHCSLPPAHSDCTKSVAVDLKAGDFQSTSNYHEMITEEAAKNKFNLTNFHVTLNNISGSTDIRLRLEITIPADGTCPRYNLQRYRTLEVSERGQNASNTRWRIHRFGDREIRWLAFFRVESIKYSIECKENYKGCFCHIFCNESDPRYTCDHDGNRVCNEGQYPMPGHFRFCNEPNWLTKEACEHHCAEANDHSKLCNICGEPICNWGYKNNSISANDVQCIKITCNTEKSQCGEHGTCHDLEELNGDTGGFFKCSCKSRYAGSFCRHMLLLPQPPVTEPPTSKTGPPVTETTAGAQTEKPAEPSSSSSTAENPGTLPPPNHSVKKHNQRTSKVGLAIGLTIVGLVAVGGLVVGYIGFTRYQKRKRNSLGPPVSFSVDSGSIFNRNYAN